MSDLVDWGLARRIACLGLSDGPAAMGSAPDLAAAGARAELAVLDYTGLTPTEPLPAPEWISRADWVEANLASMAEVTTIVAARFGESPGPAPLRAVAARVLGAEAGALLGFASRHVLGQYEYPLLGGDRPPRLVFLGENIESAAGRLDADPGALLDWIALHETTHSVHFASAPWLRGHIGGLARKLLAESPARLPAGELLERGRRLAADPRRAIAEIRESDPVSLLAPAESVATINSIQAAMASIEGYAEHVMDAAGGALGPALPAMRERLDRRRRERSMPVRLLSWLFGLELKLRQYEQGKRFWDEVAAASGIGSLNAAWAGPQTLPAPAELAAPTAWLARVVPAAAAA